MSKGNFLMGNASGKLGEIVFYRADGEQRARTYLRKFRNPQTVSQQTQRMKFRSCGLSYRLLKRAVRKTQKKENQTYFNAYMSKNVDIAPFLTKEDAVYWDSIGASPVAPWVVTIGPLVTPPALKPFQLPLSGGDGAAAKIQYTAADALGILDAALQNAQSLGFINPSANPTGGTLSFSQFCQALAGAVNTHLVFCFATGIQESSKNPYLSPSNLLCFEGGSMRLVELTDETFPSGSSVSWTNTSGVPSFSAINLDLSVNGISIAITYTPAASGGGSSAATFSVSSTYTIPKGVGAAVWVASDLDGGKTSVAQLQLSTSAQSFYEQFTEIGSSAYQVCVDSWIKSDAGGDNNVYTSAV